jgi:hypothetical protein
VGQIRVNLVPVIHAWVHGVLKLSGFRCWFVLLLLVSLELRVFQRNAILVGWSQHALASIDAYNKVLFVVCPHIQMTALIDGD